jgi:hypothetical protein
MHALSREWRAHVFQDVCGCRVPPACPCASWCVWFLRLSSPACGASVREYARAFACHSANMPKRVQRHGRSAASATQTRILESMTRTRRSGACQDNLNNLNGGRVTRTGRWCPDKQRGRRSSQGSCRGDGIGMAHAPGQAGCSALSPRSSTMEPRASLVRSGRMRFRAFFC